MVQPLSVTVSSTTDSPTILQKAADLARRLELPFVPDPADIVTRYVLACTPAGLQLLYRDDIRKQTSYLLFVDFVRGKNGYRLARNRTTKQPLARAVGIKAGFRPTVFDGTAGLGTDAFVLASLGCQVTMCERSPLLSALLEDGLSRAMLDEKTREIVSERIQLVARDSCVQLQESKTVYHTIYLDPMFPHRKQSALSKQTLRTIRDLVGDDLDGDKLLQIALKKATHRVVVKRPAGAPYLASLSPHHSVDMKKNRFDIYLTNQHG